MLWGRRSTRARLRELLNMTYHPAGVALTDSGTSALGLALRLAIERRPGRPVLLPAWGCFDLATAALGARALVLFYDVDPATLGPDWDSLAAAARLDPAAAVGVHYYGLPFDWRQFEALLRPSGACLIEDAAQGVGTEVGGRLAGTLGDLAVLSFGRGKGVTGGSGGALLVHDRSWLDPLDAVRLPRRRGSIAGVGATLAQWILTRPSLYNIPASLPFLGLGQTVFQPPHSVGGLSDFASGVLAVTMTAADEETAARRSNAAFLTERLAATRVAPMTLVPGAKPGWLRMPVRLRAGDAQSLMTDREARALGIYPSYPKVLGDLTELAGSLVRKFESHNGARELVQRLLTLPTHSGVMRPDLLRLVAWSQGVS